MNSFSTTAVAACPRCGSPGPLRESHIIPHFVVQWLRETSATDHIRSAEAPNLRIQDGLKQRLLCDSCEGRLGSWEKQVAEDVFKPLHAGSMGPFPYGPWLAKFCASVCWRSLYIHRGVDLEHLSEEQIRFADRALGFWRDFMFGRRDHPGEFELHVFTLSDFESAHGFDVPPNINRYFAREFETDIAATTKSAFIQVKMCRLLAVGFVQMPNAREWKGSRVRMRGGNLGGGQDLNTPRNFVEYLFECARHVATLPAGLSERQKQKIFELMNEDLDRTAASGSFKALAKDVELFGRAAFMLPKK